MLRDPGDFSLRPRPRQLSPAGVRFMFAAMIVMCLVGVLLVGLALGVFLTQGSQIRVTAKVLSEKCRPRTDLAFGQTETRCDADVQFTTASGQLIRTSVTNAFLYEFSGEARSRTIDLRYNSSDPAQPFKQSNYMSAGEFVLLLIIGVAAMLFGGWGLVRVRRMAASQGRSPARP
jgi:hypothetical protein